MKKFKRVDNWLLVIKRLRETTGASFLQVKDFCIRRGYYPFSRSNFVKFCNDSFIINWTKRKRK